MSSAQFWKFLVCVSFIWNFANWAFGEHDIARIKNLEAAVAQLER